MLIILSTLILGLTNAQHAMDFIGRQLSSLESSVSSSVSSSASSAVPSATPSPDLILHTLHDPPTTCQSDNITWDYSGPSPAQLTLILTNVNVNQSTPPTVNTTLGSNIDATIDNWIWQQVNVPPGYYILEGFVLDTTSQTNRFLVTNGSDTSCLQTQPPTPTPSQTTTSGSSKKVNAGAIAGATVGAAILIAVVFTALLFQKRRLAHSRRPAARRWGGLGSTDSNDPFSGGKMGLQDSDAILEHRTMDSMPTEIDPPIATASTTCSHDGMHFADDEKVVSPTTYATNGNSRPFPYTTNHRRTSTASSFRHQNHQPNSASNFSRESIAMPVIDGNNDALRRGSVDVSDHHRSVSVPSTARQPPANSPYKTEFPSSEMIHAMSGSEAVRRTSRKPVPRYDEADLEPVPHSTHTIITTTNNTHSQSSSGDARPLHYLQPDSPLAGES